MNKQELAEQILEKHLSEYWKEQLKEGHPLMASVIAAIVEAMDAPAKEGMKWVKASERLPDYGKHVHLKVSFISTPLWGWLEKSTTGDLFKTMHNGSISINEVVWLDESAPAKEAISVPVQQGVEQLIDALDACFGVMMQPYSDGNLTQKLGISTNRQEWIDARARAEKMYYEAKAAAQPLQPSLEEKKEEDL